LILDALLPLDTEVDVAIDIAHRLQIIPDVWVVKTPLFLQGTQYQGHACIHNCDLKVLLPDNNAFIAMLAIVPWFLAVSFAVVIYALAHKKK
jgi:hypothetical protein